MVNPKPSGLARFTRQAGAPAPSEPASASAPRGSTASGSTAIGTASAEVPVTPGASAAARGAPKPKLVGVYLMPDGHRQLKVEAAKRGATASDLVREALNAWFTNEQLPPLA